MDIQLVRYAGGEAAIPWRDRQFAGRARKPSNEVQIADFKASGRT